LAQASLARLIASARVPSPFPGGAVAARWSRSSCTSSRVMTVTATKAAAAAAVQRAEAAARRAVVAAGMQQEPPGRAADWDVARLRFQDEVTAWRDPLGKDARSAQFLRACSELRDVSSSLREQQNVGGHLEHIDRYIGEVERMRGSINTVCPRRSAPRPAQAMALTSGYESGPPTGESWHAAERPGGESGVKGAPKAAQQSAGTLRAVGRNNRGGALQRSATTSAVPARARPSPLCHGGKGWPQRPFACPRPAPWRCHLRCCFLSLGTACPRSHATTCSALRLGYPKR